jgi:TM2 domain-containing membrane protein YozV
MESTHSKTIGYVLWIFGFTGSHRFYFGKPISGLIWLCTGGLFLVGWIIDIFLIPGMERKAELRYKTGSVDYSVAWILLTFLGLFGVHRMYMGKWLTGILYLCTGGLFLIGWAYDFCTLNTQITEINARDGGKSPGVSPAPDRLIEG